MTMELIPAIDMLGGSAVRLVEGDYERSIGATASAVELAVGWARAGIRRLHVVDLDGARAGRPVQFALAARVARSVRAAASEPVTIELGGGLRTTEDIGAAIASGIDLAILGTAAIESPSLVAEAVARWPGRIGASLDLRDSRPTLDGWTRTIDADPIEVARRLLSDGAERLILTDDVTAPSAGRMCRCSSASVLRFPTRPWLPPAAWPASPIWRT
jgi:phosphoribosylformimino-5-aminoimidazole carboxamide ribotide isomerase